MTTKKSNTLVTVIALFLVIVLLVGALGYLSKGFKDWNAKDWFKSEQTDADTEGENASAAAADVLIIDDQNNVFKAGGTYDLPGSLSFSYNKVYSPLMSDNAVLYADNAQVILNATIKPSSVLDKNIIWNISWNPSFNDGGWSEYLNVEDYVSLIPEYDYAPLAVVTLLQPFGCQILITASTLTSSVSAVCTVDFRKSVMNVARHAVETPFLSFYFDMDSIALNHSTYYAREAEQSYRFTDSLSYDFTPFTIDRNFESSLTLGLNLSYASALSIVNSIGVLPFSIERSPIDDTIDMLNGPDSATGYSIYDLLNHYCQLYYYVGTETILTYDDFVLICDYAAIAGVFQRKFQFEYRADFYVDGELITFGRYGIRLVYDDIVASFDVNEIIF